MKIGIIGAGSVGLLCAAYLAEKHEVTLFTHRKSQAELLSKNGLTLEKESTRKSINVRAEVLSGSTHLLEQLDLVFVTVKQYHITDLLPLIQSIQTKFIFLQNGMPRKELLTAFSGKIFFGIVIHGAQRISDDIVCHHGSGKIVLDAAIEKHVRKEELSVKNFPFEMTEDILIQMRDKLIVNAIVNPISAVYRVKNGEIVRNPELDQLKNQLAKEVFQILQMNELDEQEKALENVNQICLRTFENKTSMLQDVENGRQTEVDSILGYLLEQANELQIDAPLVNKLYLQVKELS